MYTRKLILRYSRIVLKEKENFGEVEAIKISKKKIYIYSILEESVLFFSNSINEIAEMVIFINKYHCSGIFYFKGKRVYLSILFKIIASSTFVIVLKVSGEYTCASYGTHTRTVIIFNQMLKRTVGNVRHIIE